MKKGQILIITLLVLTVLSILTITLVVLNNRDVSQSVNTETYEKIYNSSESKLREVLSKVADPSVALTDLNKDYPGGICSISGETSTCKFTLNSDDPSSTITYDDTVIVSNEKDIVDFSLNKDRPITLSVKGYSSNITITTNKLAALDFSLIYFAGGYYKSFSGVYDPTGTYRSSGTFQSSYIVKDPLNPLSFKLTLLSSFGGSELLSITPRSKTAGDSVLITIKPQDYSSYQPQVRKFASEAFTSNDTDSPVVRLISQIPLLGQTDGLLDYSLLTPDTVTIKPDP